MATRTVDIGIVGATGLVGREILSVLEKRRFPVGKLAAYNSGRRAGAVRFRGKTIATTAPSFGNLAQSKLVFLVSSDAVSARWGRALAERGVYVIDDSSNFRLASDVPLIIPEINGHTLVRNSRLIAGPNCTLTGAAVAGWPLIKKAGAKAVRLASYQAVSGAGREALMEFHAHIRAAVGALKRSDPLALPDKPKAKAMPRSAAFNVFPQVGSFNGEGESSEEVKIRQELRKIWGMPELPISCTAVRVPVLRGHSLALWLETKEPLSPANACRLLECAPGVQLWEGGKYPTPLEVGESYPVHVSRIRQGASARELALWVVSDNLLKGAALNSVQIAETLLERRWL